MKFDIKNYKLGSSRHNDGGLNVLKNKIIELHISGYEYFEIISVISKIQQEEHQRNITKLKVDTGILK